MPDGPEIGPRGPGVQVFVGPNVPEGPGIGPRGPSVWGSKCEGVQGFHVAQRSSCAMGLLNCAWFVDSSKQLDR